MMLLSDARHKMHEYDARIYELRMHMMPRQLVDNTQKLKPKQPVRTVIRLGPTPLKRSNQRKIIPKISQKELAM